MSEQVQTRRIPYGAYIEEESNYTFYLAHSLSPSGLRLMAKDPPQIGRPVRLRLVVENEPRVMSVFGEVVSPAEVVSPGELPDEPTAFAVRFTNLDSDGHAFLAELAAELSQPAQLEGFAER